MNFRILANVIIFLLVASGVHSSRLLRSRTEDDKVVKRATASTTSRSGREPGLMTKGQPKLVSKAKSSNKKVKQQTIERMTLRARTTLLMNDQEMKCFEPAEAVFFEETWKVAYKMIQDDKGEMMDIRSVVIQEDLTTSLNDHSTRRRHLLSEDVTTTTSTAATSRDDLAIQSGKQVIQRKVQQQQRSKYFFLFTPNYYFDIWSIIEVTCFLCSDERRLEEAIVENVDVEYKEMNSRFEMLLCEMLREGPYECFQSVESCQVTFVST